MLTGGLLGCMLLFSAAPGYGLQMVYPVDGSWLTASGYLIIKGGDKPALDGVAIDINGVKSDVIDISAPAYRKAFRDFVILQADFDPGVNRIVIEGYLGSKRVSEVRSEIFLVDERTQAPPAKFRAGPFHLPEREALCQGCHSMNPSAQELAQAQAKKNPCGSCHARMLDRKHVHGPAGVFECTYCHQTDSRPAKYVPRDADGKICLECHDDKVKEYRAAKFVHGPVEAVLCVVCHDPHASDQPAQLVEKANDLCSSCHAEVREGQHVLRGVQGSGHPLSGRISPLDPGKEFNCASCHDPHAGQGPELFRGGVTNRFEFCRLCHKK